MVVMLAALVRWLPAPASGPSAPSAQGPDALGRGDAWVPLKISSRLGATASQPGQSLAGLRGGFNAQGTARHYRWLQLVGQIEARTAPDATIQLKGVSRNEGWILRYDLYPRRVVGEPAESGGGLEDPTLPGVAAVLVGASSARTQPQVLWVEP